MLDGESSALPAVLRFGIFELDPATCELRRRGALVRLPLQPARVLRRLAQRPGELVTREELRRELWGEDVFVDYDAGLAACINQVRGALGDRAASPRFVETLPRLGYRFIAEVRYAAPIADETPRASPPSRLRTVRPGARIGGRRLAVGAGLVALTLAVLFGVVQRQPARSPRIPSVVVLPIPTPAGDASLAAIADTLTEGVIGELATLAGPRARIASRAQSDRLRGQDVDLAAIRGLGAEYFVAMTLRHVGKPVRVHAKLAHASGWILWSTDYDLDEQSLATLQADIAVTVARKAAHEIVPPSHRSPAREPAPAAVADYAQANSDLEGGRVAASLAGYGRALRADPRHLGSYEGLAEAHLALALDDPAGAAGHFAAAQDAVERALAIDPNLAGAIAMQGALVFARDFEPERAERLLRRAVALEPWLASARLWHAAVLAALGDFDTATGEAQAGRDLAPLSWIGNRVLGHTDLLAGRYREVGVQVERILALDPGAAIPHLWRAIAADHLGEVAQAARSRRDFVAALGLSPRADSLSWTQVDAALAAQPDGQHLWLRAEVAALSDHPGEALRRLEECRRLRLMDLLWLARNPAFEGLRGQPAFVAWLAAPLAPVVPPKAAVGS